MNRSVIQPDGHRRRDYLLVLLSLLIFAYGVSRFRELWNPDIAILHTSTEFAGIDYFHFWIVGRSQEKIHPKNIYSAPGRRAMEDYAATLVPRVMVRPSRLFIGVQFWHGEIKAFSTPFLYAAVNWLSVPRLHHGGWMDRFDRNLLQFREVSFLAYVVGFLLLCSSLGYSLGLSVLFLATTFLCFRSLKADMDVANVAQLQLGGLAFYIITRRGRPGLVRDILGGGILGFLIAFKPNLVFVPILLGVAWIFDRRWKTLLVQSVCGIITLTAAVICGCLFLHSPTAWIDWIHGLRVIGQVSDISLQRGNYSLAQMVLERFGLSISAYLTLAVLTIGIRAIWSSRRKGETHYFQRDYLIAAIGGAAGLLCVKLVWMHYYVLSLPLLIYLFSPAVKRASGRQWYVERAVAIAVLLLLFNDPILYFIDIPNDFYRSALFVCAAWELFFLSLWHLQRPLPDAEPAESSLASVSPFESANVG